MKPWKELATAAAIVGILTFGEAKPAYSQVPLSPVGLLEVPSLHIDIPQLPTIPLRIPPEKRTIQNHELPSSYGVWDLSGGRALGALVNYGGEDHVYTGDFDQQINTIRLTKRGSLFSAYHMDSSQNDPSIVVASGRHAANRAQAWITEDGGVTSRELLFKKGSFLDTKITEDNKYAFLSYTDYEINTPKVVVRFDLATQDLKEYVIPNLANFSGYDFFTDFIYHPPTSSYSHWAAPGNYHGYFKTSFYPDGSVGKLHVSIDNGRRAMGMGQFFNNLGDSMVWFHDWETGGIIETKNDATFSRFITSLQGGEISAFLIDKEKDTAYLATEQGIEEMSLWRAENRRVLPISGQWPQGKRVTNIQKISGGKELLAVGFMGEGKIIVLDPKNPIATLALQRITLRLPSLG